MAQVSSAYPDYSVVSDEDGRWYVIDGQCVLHNSPFHSRDAAINHRDDLAMKIDQVLSGATA